MLSIVIVALMVGYVWFSDQTTANKLWITAAMAAVILYI